VGPVLGRFEVLGRLGRGGMGTVLEAYDRTLDRKVALKHLHEDTAGQHRPRLLREAQALARMSHPNVVQVFETGEADGRLYIAMELVPGRTLAKWLHEAHDWRTCLEVYGQAARGREGLAGRSRGAARSSRASAVGGGAGCPRSCARAGRGGSRCAERRSRTSHQGACVRRAMAG